MSNMSTYCHSDTDCTITSRLYLCLLNVYAFMYHSCNMNFASVVASVYGKLTCLLDHIAVLMIVFKLKYYKND